MKMIWILKDATEWVQVRHASFAVNNLNRPYAPTSMVFIDVREVEL